MAELGSGGGSGYPGALDTDNSVETDGVTTARADVPNDLAAAIIAIETELGTDPAGTLTDVKTFLQTEHGTNGKHSLLQAVIDPWFDVRAYGAEIDGTTDDSGAINNAISAAYSAGGGTVILPPGQYSIASSIVMKNKVELVGLGTGSPNTSNSDNNVRILPTAAVSVAIYYDGTTGRADEGGITLRNFVIDMTNMADGSKGIHWYVAWRSRAERVSIINADGASTVGFHIQSNATTGCFWNVLQQVYINSTSYSTQPEAAFKIEGTASKAITALTMINCQAIGGVDAIKCSDIGTGCVIISTDTGQCDIGVHVTDASTIWMTVLTSELNATTTAIRGKVWALNCKSTAASDYDNLGNNTPNWQTGAEMANIPIKTLYTYHVIDSTTNASLAAGGTVGVDEADTYLVAANAAGPVSMGNPQLANGLAGQRITLIGTSDTNYIRLSNGNGLDMKRGFLDLKDRVAITYKYDGTDWVEINRGMASLGHVADAETSHAVSDFPGTNTALDNLGSKINTILSRLESWGINATS